MNQWRKLRCYLGHGRLTGSIFRFVCIMNGVGTRRNVLSVSGSVPSFVDVFVCIGLSCNFWIDFGWCVATGFCQQQEVTSVFLPLLCIFSCLARLCQLFWVGSATQQYFMDKIFDVGRLVALFILLGLGSLCIRDVLWVGVPYISGTL